MTHFTRCGIIWRLLGPALVLVILAAVACGSAAPATTAPAAATTAPATAAAAPTAVPEAMAEPEAKVNPGKLTIMVGDLGAERFDSAIGTGDASYARLLYGQLIESNEKAELIPGIASEWSFSADGMTQNFTIREGVKFHDGTELTAEDVRWTLNRKIGPPAGEYTMASQAAAYSQIIEQIEFTAPNVVSVRFNRVEAGFFGYNSAAGSFSTAFIPERDTLRDEALETAYEKNPIGVGPMKFVRHVPAEVMEFERFDDYYFQPANGFHEDRRVNFQSLDLFLVPEEATRVAALRAGEVDIAPVGVGQKGQVEGAGGRIIFGPEGANFRTLWAGCWSDPSFPCADKRVRQAFAYALDKELMRDSLWGSEMMENKGWHMVTPSSLGYSPELAPFPFDPDKARALLAEAGYRTPSNPDGKDFGKLVVNTWQSGLIPFMPESAQLAASMWDKELGIDTEVRVGERVSLLNAHRSGDLDGSILWRDNDGRLDGANLARAEYANFKNRRRVTEDPEIFALVNETLAIYDPEERPKALNRMYLRLRDEQYHLGWASFNIPWGVGPRVLEWQPYPFAFFPSALHTIVLK